MNKKILIAIILIILFTLGYFVIKNNKNNNQLLSPNYKKVESFVAPSIIPSPKPNTFKFDRSTDLKKELENVSPQVLDSDFE